MANNNHAGMHYIQFARHREALHEFDYDNEYVNRSKPATVRKYHSSVWHLDGTPVMHRKRRRNRRVR